MSDVYDIDLIRGSSLAIRFAAKDTSNNILNLTGYAASGFVKYKYSDTGYVIFLTSSITSPASGFVDVTITEPQSSSLKTAKYVYDIEAYNSSLPKTIKIARGYLNVFPEVTR